MPLATFTQTVFNTTPLTVAGVLGAIRTAMTVATQQTAAAPFLVTTDLFSDRSTSSTSSGFLVYRIIGDSTRAKGTAFLRINATLSGSTISLSQSMSDTWDTATNTVVSGSPAAGTASTTVGLNTASPLTLTTVKHPEMQLVLVDQGVTPIAALGWVRPAFKNPAWDETACPFILCPNDATFTAFNGVNGSLLPYTSISNFPLGGWVQFQRVNPKSLQPDVKPGVDLLTSSNEGAAGTFSADVAIAATAGITRMNTVSLGTQTYTILTTNGTNYNVLLLGNLA